MNEKEVNVLKQSVMASCQKGIRKYKGTLFIYEGEVEQHP